MPDLTTTNILLGVLAAVSILEALAIVALIAGTLFLYSRLLRLIAGIEERHIAPVTARVTSVLDDAKRVSSAVSGAAGAADSSVRWGLEWLLRQMRDRGDR
jgi:hypothetical protein